MIISKSAILTAYQNRNRRNVPIRFPIFPGGYFRSHARDRFKEFLAKRGKRVPGGTVLPAGGAVPVSTVTVPAPVPVPTAPPPMKLPPPNYDLSGLGFSLKPPAWLRNFAGAIMKGTQISIPTPAGVPIVVDGSDPQALQKVLDALKGTRVSTTVGTPRPSFPQQAAAAIESIPGGWATVAAVAVAAFLLMRRR